MHNVEDALLKVGDLVNTPIGARAVGKVRLMDLSGEDRQWFYLIDDMWCPERLILRWELERLEH